MSVVVVPMRKRGVPIDARVREAGAYVGRLKMYDYDDPVLRRRVRKLDLLEPGRPNRPTPMLPGLHDVTLVTIDEDSVVLTGFERLSLPDGKQVDYAQSWWVVGAVEELKRAGSKLSGESERARRSNPAS